MRNGFAEQMVALASKDPNVFLLVGDIGFRLFDEFQDKFKERFINCGIAEQNMLSVAAGLASEGKKVFVYTITPFLIMRAFEQIRVDLGINSTNIVLVGVGGGLAYDKLGPTHHAYEDITLMRVIPDMRISLPFDRQSTRLAVEKAYNNLETRSTYIRLSKGGEPDIPEPSEVRDTFWIWKPESLARDVIVCHGSILSRFVEIGEQGKVKNLVISILEFESSAAKEVLSYLEKEGLTDKRIAVYEECFRVGSFYESFCTELVQQSKSMEVTSVCLPLEYRYEVSSRENMLDSLGFVYNV